jgi:hypothetical protein
MLSYKRLSLAKVRELNAQYGSSVMAGRKRYKLIWCEWVRWDSNDLHGLCDSDERKIYVTTIQLQETLAHELMHAEIFETGMRQMPSWNQNLEELVCEAASRMFSQYKIRRER